MSHFDNLGCLVRDFYPEGHIANLGDSCAETSRICLLEGGHNFAALLKFGTLDGFLRHPNLAGTDWGYPDFSNDQLLPWLMALDLNYPDIARAVRQWSPTRIHGTRTFLSIGSWALVHQWHTLLNLVNIVQGLILRLPYRIGDGGKIERTEGQVQDYLNMVCTYVYLQRLSKWATLPRDKAICLDAIRRYYNTEPNSAWIVNAYERALT